MNLCPKCRQFSVDRESGKNSCVRNECNFSAVVDSHDMKMLKLLDSILSETIKSISWQDSYETRQQRFVIRKRLVAMGECTDENWPEFVSFNENSGFAAICNINPAQYPGS